MGGEGVLENLEEDLNRMGGGGGAGGLLSSPPLTEDIKGEIFA
jgi:hypothetical protein